MRGMRTFLGAAEAVMEHYGLEYCAAIPTAPEGGYCPYLIAADNPTNHVAISLHPMMDGLTPIGAAQSRYTRRTAQGT